MSLSAETTVSQKLRYFVGNFFSELSTKTKLSERAANNCLLSNNFFDIISAIIFSHWFKQRTKRMKILTNQNCSLFVNGKTKMSVNRFDTVHVISSASMLIFGSNTQASFRNFFNDEIKLSGDWRATLSEIFFPTKIEHILNGDLIAYSLKGYEDSQTNLSDANVIFRPYNGEKLSFMTIAILTRLINFSVQSSEQLDYPIFLFEKSILLEKLKLFFVNMNESRFLVNKYPALWALREF